MRSTATGATRACVQRLIDHGARATRAPGGCLEPRLEGAGFGLGELPAAAPSTLMPLSEAGLWLAVTMTPASACCWNTAQETAAVGNITKVAGHTAARADTLKDGIHQRCAGGAGIPADQDGWRPPKRLVEPGRETSTDGVGAVGGDGPLVSGTARTPSVPKRMGD